MTSTERRGWWRRARTSVAELDAQELQTQVQARGVRAIGACGVGDRCSITGVITTMTLRPRAGVPALSAELFDGSGTVRLLWLGRRRIVGIEPGRSLVVTGRITAQGAERVIFNPRYRLLAPDHG